MEERIMDYFTKKGAEELAYRIKYFWAMKGQKIETEVSKNSGKNIHGENTYSVRSNLINGLPKQKTVDVGSKSMQ